MDVLAELRASISRTCDVPVDSIHAESDLEELGVDSLASAEMVTDLRDPARPGPSCRRPSPARWRADRGGRRDGDAGQLRPGGRRVGSMTRADALRAAGTSPAAIAAPLRPLRRVLRAVAGRRPGLLVRTVGRHGHRGHPGAERSSASSTISRPGSAWPAADVLDVGCGWGALLDRFTGVHGAAGGVGSHPEPGTAAVR